MLALITRPLDAEVAMLHLARFPFDCESELAVLSTAHIREALKQFISGQITAQDIERWAGAVEGRDDIGYSEGEEEAIAEYLFVLSEPAINGALTVERATNIARGLRP